MPPGSESQRWSSRGVISGLRSVGAPELLGDGVRAHAASVVVGERGGEPVDDHAGNVARSWRWVKHTNGSRENDNVMWNE